MAASFLCSPASVEIRQLVVHSYPAGIKAADAERFTVFHGRRGKPVKWPRFVLAELAHELAWNVAAPKIGAISVR